MPTTDTGTAYTLRGPLDAPVVILIHGLGLTRQSTWQDFIPQLAQHYRVLSYDLCGHGQSARTQQTPSLRVLAEQLRDLMDTLEIPQATLVGFSLGGMINRRMAMDYPERVQALVVLNSPHQRSPQAQEQVEARAAAGGPAATIDATLARWFTPDYLQKRPERVAQVRAVVLANDDENYIQHRQVLAAGVKELIEPQPPITHPTLVMTCAHDSGSTPMMSHAIGAEIADAQVHIVADLQHLGLIEAPGQFLNTIKPFIDRVCCAEKP